MSETTASLAAPEPHTLQHRVLALSQQALEGERPLSDLLGEALRELRESSSRLLQMEAELRDRDQSIRALRMALAGAEAPDSSPAPRADERTNPAPAEPLDLLWKPLPRDAAELQSCLLSRIAGALYLGAVRAGDRLPSIREVERRTGLNHKVIRRIYRALERGGLAEVRDRSGIYVGEIARPEEGHAAEVDGWTAEVVGEAVQRGISAGELPALLARAVAGRPLRCACVESTRDDRSALCEEIQRRFAIQAVPVEPTPEALRDAVQGADLVVTTPFHADLVRRALAPGQPLVVAALHPAVGQAIHAGLNGIPVRIICEDAAAGERIRQAFGPEIAAQLRVVTVDQIGDGGGREARGPAVATPAAWAALGGGAPPSGLRVPPYLAPAVSRHIAHLLVRLNREVDGG